MLSRFSLIHREPRVFLFAKERPQLPHRRVRLDRDDVGTRRHHFAHERVAEVDDRLQQPALVAARSAPALRPPRGRRAPPLRCSSSSCVRTTGARGAPRQQPDQPAGKWRHRTRDHAERRQQRRQDRFGVPPHDHRRQQVLADQDVDRDAREQRGQPTRGQPERPVSTASSTVASEKMMPSSSPPARTAERIVEVVPEAVVAAAALGHQPQRQLHQRAERRLDGPEVDRRARRAGTAEAGSSQYRSRHAAGARSIRPARQAALPRSRRSSAPSGRRRPARGDRNPEGAAGHAGPGPSARRCRNAPRSRAWRRATPIAMTMSPSSREVRRARAGAAPRRPGKRQDVGGGVPAAKLLVEGAHAGVA